MSETVERLRAIGRCYEERHLERALVSACRAESVEDRRLTAEALAVGNTEG